MLRVAFSWHKVWVNSLKTTTLSYFTYMYILFIYYLYLLFYIYTFRQLIIYIFKTRKNLTDNCERLNLPLWFFHASTSVTWELSWWGAENSKKLLKEMICLHPALHALKSDSTTTHRTLTIHCYPCVRGIKLTVLPSLSLQFSECHCLFTLGCFNSYVEHCHQQTQWLHCTTCNCCLLVCVCILCTFIWYKYSLLFRLCTKIKHFEFRQQCQHEWSLRCDI